MTCLFRYLNQAKTLYTVFLIKKIDMVQQTPLGGIIEFFKEIGMYDVVLPFLLVFTIVFAILEKTKVFGVEEIGDKKYTRKNINAMVAFVVGFIVVASSRIVSVINKVMGNVVLLLLVSVCFLLLIGSFMKEGEVRLEKGGWQTFFMFFMFIGVALIFLHALGWLDVALSYVIDYWSTPYIGAILMFIVIGVVMYYITKERKPEVAKPEEKK
jgi:hypothetical membrane protein